MYVSVKHLAGDVNDQAFRSPDDIKERNPFT